MPLYIVYSVDTRGFSEEEAQLLGQSIITMAANWHDDTLSSGSWG